jgi:hypothetical protein
MTAEDVARWMLAQIKRDSLLYQHDAVYQIIQNFGEEFTYINANGNPAIERTCYLLFRN